MKVEIEEMHDKSGWVVLLDTCKVDFRTEQEARVFAERLQARLEAPHDFPPSCDELIGDLT